jgi:hypothetical protein
MNFRLPDNFSKGKLGYGITYNEARLCREIRKKKKDEESPEFNQCITAFDD